MDVIGHQGIRVDAHLMLQRRLAKTSQIEDIVVIMIERCVSIIAALEDVVRQAGYANSFGSGHPMFLAIWRNELESSAPPEVRLVNPQSANEWI